ncbi:MAG: tRNA delta(2)-isopentenylpyrophosphate transferase [Flavipsychrobacter sp.]|jgi:tRNA dimethylallyltransferase|nr:tRNA delta(2)-isopentenylpyrophosphate transferase [Flavipsychrobacter sp.]
MTIGTAKPSPEELQAVKHYFIDEFPVTRPLSAADYETLALIYLDEIFLTHDTAVVCGGTGLYIKALCEGLDAMPEVDEEVVKQTEEEYKQQGIEWLQKTVQAEDPEFYEVGEIQNPARMLRALSFMRSTGRSIVHYRTASKMQRPFNIVKIGLELPREQLYDRINQRVDKMMEQGLLAEVEKLYPHKELKNLQTVGYAELFDYIDGKYTLPEAIDKIKQHTRNYAKRQMTWFKKDKEVRWFNAEGRGVMERILVL